MEKPGLFVLLVAALAFAALLASCAPGGSDGKAAEEKATAPQGGETKEKAERQGATGEETTTPQGRTVAEETTAPEFAVGPSPADEEEDDSGFEATVRVTNVVDGDTVDIAPAVEGEDRVRLIGVDTPETRDPDCGVQPYGDEATAFTASELQGQEVGLEFDAERTDRYGRLLAYVYPSDGEMFNETLLAEGTPRSPPSRRTSGTWSASSRPRRGRGRPGGGCGASPPRSSPRRWTGATA